MLSGNLKKNTRILIILCVFALIFVVLVFRVLYLKTIRGEELSQKAYEQQTRDSLISPKRGTIYDTNGKELAVSITVETIAVVPSNVKTEEMKGKIAKYFSENHGLVYDEVIQILNKKTSVPQTLMKKVDKTVTDAVRTWVSTEKIKGISIVEDTKRSYPHGSLASHVLGFCGTDNQGLYGIEAKYEKYLKGVPGKLVATKDANGNEMPVESSTYINPENGYNVTLTIDEVIQHIAEKHLKQAIEENECKNGGTVLIMKPKTGEILAMASMPDYDLNNPFTPTEKDILDIWDTMTTEQKIEVRNEMWRNNVISQTYEPGSTFKVITASIGVEEQIVNPTQEGVFNCSGHITIGGARMNCWRYYNPHGSQSLTKALQNSCNPCFISLGQNIGTETFYKYLRLFGFMETTGIDLPSESNSAFHKEENCGPVELATISFGQRFEITPLQLVTAVSAIANDGKLVKPYIVKEITDENNIVKKTETTVVRQVISEETADKVLAMMETVVSLGTGKNAQVAGYKIGGKTGTAEQGIGEGREYIASFIGIAPVSDPELVILVTLDQPTGPQGRQGGGIAAPLAQKILEESIEYLNIKPDYEVEDTVNSNEIQLPDVRTKTVAEAKKTLEKLGLIVDISCNGDYNSSVVTDQMPVAGTRLKRNSIVKIYSEDSEVRVSIEVPDVKDKTAAEAEAILKEKGLNIKTTGSGYVTSQDPPAGTQVEKGTIVRVELKAKNNDLH